jgi:serine/threonine-protein kinase
MLREWYAVKVTVDGIPFGAVLGGRYRIEGRAGSGGMGDVYHAFDLRLDHHVALKVLAVDNVTPSALRRFETEARAAARLKSPYSVRVFDVDFGDPVQPFLVMELFSGNDLAAECSERPVSLDDFLTWMEQVADALAEAHQAGIIHRDIKPQNVFLANEGRERIAKVLDFGISKILAESPLDSTMNTGIMGTAGYLAPEYIRGRGADHRVDIFAFGVMMYRCLSGMYPFGEIGPKGLPGVLYDDAIDLARVAPTVPADVCSVVMHCIAREPAKRFQSAHALGRALSRCRNAREDTQREVNGLRSATGSGWTGTAWNRTATTLRVAVLRWGLILASVAGGLAAGVAWVGTKDAIVKGAGDDAVPTSAPANATDPASVPFISTRPTSAVPSTPAARPSTPAPRRGTSAPPSFRPVATPSPRPATSDGLPHLL